MQSPHFADAPAEVTSRFLKFSHGSAVPVLLILGDFGRFPAHDLHYCLLGYRYKASTIVQSQSHPWHQDMLKQHPKGKELGGYHFWSGGSRAGKLILCIRNSPEECLAIVQGRPLAAPTRCYGSSSWLSTPSAAFVWIGLAAQSSLDAVLSPC